MACSPIINAILDIHYSLKGAASLSVDRAFSIPEQWERVEVRLDDSHVVILLVAHNSFNATYMDTRTQEELAFTDNYKDMSPILAEIGQTLAMEAQK